MKKSLFLHLSLSTKNCLQQQIHYSGNIFGNKCSRCNEGSLYSQTSIIRTSLGLWKFVLDIGSSSQWEVIKAPGQEADMDILGMSFQSSIK